MSQSYDDGLNGKDELAWVGVRLEPGESMSEYMKGKSTSTPSEIDGFAKSRDCAAIKLLASSQPGGLILHDCSKTDVPTFFCQLGT